jgi:diguanylate cyclase
MIVPESWWLLFVGISLLTCAAVFGYRYGLLRSRRVWAERPDQRTEIQRALSVIEELDGIAARLRKAISQHGSATRRYTARLTRYEGAPNFSHHDLCDRAEEMLKHANRLTGEISFAYANLLQQMTHLSAFAELRSDPLTGAANRQSLDESLSGILAGLSRHSTPAALAIVDIDFFTQLNDSRSMLQGDRVLVALVELLRRQTRPCDLLARYVGEKFVVVMPQTDLSVGAELVETMRRGVQSKLPVTVSAGVAASAYGDTCSTLFNRAESALAKAKGAGRNCVYLHEGTLGRIVGFESKPLQSRAIAQRPPAPQVAATAAAMDETLADVLARS